MIILLIFLFFLTSCAHQSIPQITPAKNFDIPLSLENRKICVVDFFPLPENYPPNADLSEFSLTQELYNGKEGRIFVPRNYQKIIFDTIILALAQKNIKVEKYPSTVDAIMDNCHVILTGAVKESKVIEGKFGKHSFSAIVSLYIRVLEGKDAIILLEKGISSTVNQSDIGMSDISIGETEILTLNEESSLHPLRTLLSLATYNLLDDLMKQIDSALVNKK